MAGTGLAGLAVVLGRDGPLNRGASAADTACMTALWLAPYAMLWIVLMRALLVRARVLSPMCARCGLQHERQHLGERICSCSV